MTLRRVAVFMVLAIAAACLLAGLLHSPMDAQSRRIMAEWPPASTKLKMSMQVRKHDGKEFLGFTLTNISHEPITLTATEYPWETPGFFEMWGVTSEGRVIRPPGIVTQPVEEVSRRQTIGAGESVEGEVETLYLPIIVDRKEDVLLVWRYPAYNVVGTTFLEHD
jgi:hypothetical protein